MTSYAALLRAVNVGGTGRLPMAELRTICGDLGFGDVRTYIASGNAVFRSLLPEAQVKARLEAALLAYAGKPVGVLVRSAAELADVLSLNPFAAEAGDRVLAVFLDAPPDASELDRATGRTSELLALGAREIYVFHPHGQAVSRLRVPAAAAGTARNMNTVAKLAEMAG